MEDEILKLLGRKDYVPANVPELLQGLKRSAKQQQQLQNSLKELARSGQIARIKGNRYILPREADLIPGRIQITRHGRGFLTPDDPGLGEISISSSGTATALHEDHVLVRRDVQPQGKLPNSEKRETGTVVRVLERRRSQIVGTFKRGKQFLYVIPDDPRMPHDIYVPKPRDVGRPARDGDKVVVDILQWESRHTNPEGEITEVLGPPTEEGVDMLAVLRQYDLSLKFPRKVLQEVRRFGTEVSPADLEGRTDCRSHSVITIDPADAKDFDDAFCLKQTVSGRWKLWVHIADVSHYVKPGSALDVEAQRRGNSTYLVDRVVPMLPEVLSNELCSLVPDVDRLTKCVEFLIAEDGQVLRSTFYPAVIHSQQRFSYEEAFAVLQGKPDGPIEQMLHEAGRLAMRIRRRRFKAGSLELDFPETKIRLDDHGRVRKIEKVDNDQSHQLIEEFMLLANEAVAGRLMKLRQPALHRVHEEPEPRRLADYREEVLSHNVHCGNLEKPAEVQKLLRRLGDLAIGPALKIGFLKSLMRARYAVEPLGHYGLAKAKYTHFTSPIRRYADLVVHRSLFEQEKITLSSLRKVADHISRTERNSADAERDSKDVKLYAYLNEQLKTGKPQHYTALVTDLRNFGFFVDVADLGMSGLVPLSLLKDDFYELDTVRGQIQGRRNRRTIRLGDRVEVVVGKVDSFKKQVDFRLARAEGKAIRGKPPVAKMSGSHKRGSKKKARQKQAPPLQKKRSPRRRPKRHKQKQERRDHGV
jgi:ribonuclease R